MRLQLFQLFPLSVEALLEIETPEDGDHLVHGVGLVEHPSGHLYGAAAAMAS